MTDATPNSTPGRRGHTRTTRDHGLRLLLRRLRDENPRASKSEVEVLYMAEYRQDDDLIEAAGIRVFGNDYESLMAQEDAEPQPQSAPVRQRQAVERVQQPVRPIRRVSAADLAAIGQRVRNIILLELPTANGKKLGDCTAPELRALGGWHFTLADRIGDDTTIARESVARTRRGAFAMRQASWRHSAAATHRRTRRAPMTSRGRVLVRGHVARR